MHKQLFLTGMIFFLCSALFSQVDSVRIEPPHWWIGMKNPVVQLMIKYKGITGLPLKINKEGVSIKKIHKAEHPDYLFLDLSIHPLAKPGIIHIRIGNQTIDYPLYQRTPGSASHKGFNTADVIYLISPDRFANGDIQNDNLTAMKEQADRRNQNGRHGGDIKGIIDHLDYIRDMGFTAIWSTPVLENNLSSFTYHGYAISDFYKVDPRMGTNALYRELASGAKSKGIKLIMDIVLNHCGSGHWWMKDMPFKDWINYDGSYVSTNNRREANQDPHAALYDQTLMSRGWFVPSMPDLNQRNPHMALYLIQNTIWWIEFAGLDGLRIDTYPYVDKTFSTQWTTSILAEYPGLNMVGEEWSYNPLVTSYWQRGQKNKDGYRSSLPSVMDFPLQQSMVRALNEDESNFNGGWAHIYQTLANDFIYPDPDNLVIFTDNHDMSRFFTQIRENVDSWKKGMVFLCTIRGIPQIYYGTEVLITNPVSDEHGEIRADMPGGWPGDKKNAFTQAGLSPQELEAQSFLQQLVHLRKSSPALQSGRLVHYGPQQGVYVYFRMKGQEKYMIILSKNQQAVDLDIKIYEEWITPDLIFKNVLSHEIESTAQATHIPAGGYKILKIEHR